MAAEDRLNLAMGKHCFLSRMYQCLMTAGNMIDGIGEHVDDAVAMEISKVVDIENLTWISDTLTDLANKCQQEASKTKDDVIKMMAHKRHHEESEDGEESRKTDDELVVLQEMPRPKRMRMGE